MSYEKIGGLLAKEWTAADKPKSEAQFSIALSPNGKYFVCGLMGVWSLSDSDFTYGPEDMPDFAGEFVDFMKRQGWGELSMEEAASVVWRHFTSPNEPYSRREIKAQGAAELCFVPKLLPDEEVEQSVEVLVPNILGLV